MSVSGVLIALMKLLSNGINVSFSDYDHRYKVQY